MIITGTRVRGGKYYGGTASAVTTDEYFNLVSLLLPGNGTNGAQNNTFLDSSTNNFTVTRNGNTTQGTFSPFSFGGGTAQANGYYSGYFDGTGDYLSVASNDALGVGSGDFTVECWIYLTQNFDATGQGVVTASYNTNFAAIGTNPGAGNRIDFYVANVILTSGTNYISLNTWTHLAFVRLAGTTRIYFNGVQVASSGSLTGTGAAAALYVGTLSHDLNQEMTGYISNVRLVKGTAVYTANFTVPTTPLTNITNTSLLTCQSSQFIDNSTNAFAITPVGNSQPTVVNPFGMTDWSGYFDGTGDYLSVADNAALDMGSSDFTMECWVYLNEAASSSDGIFAKRADISTYGGVLFYINSTTPALRATTSGSAWNVEISSSITIGVGTWNHLAITRSGSTWTIWVNGVSGATATVSGTVPDNSSAFVIAAYDSGGNASYIFPSGLISNARVVKGTAVYTSNFTPPTAPLTAISGTSLLTCQSSTFIDNSPNAFAITVNGNAYTLTLNNPFGSIVNYTTPPLQAWSNYFDGTDSLTIPTGAFSYTSGTAFTFECWVYRSSTTGSSSLAQIVVGTVNGGQALSVYVTNTGQAIYGQANVTDIIASSTGVISLNQWYHIAISKNASNTVRMWVNGTSVGTTTDSRNYAVSSMYIGRNQNNTQNLDGYVSNLRSVVGSSVYDPTQTTITVPTTPLTAISGTSLLTCQSNNFVDNSINRFAITRNGDTSVQPFSPFNPDAAYSTTSVGGSGYFDGTGDYLSIADNATLEFGSSDFTIEAFIYPTATTGANRPIWSHGTNSTNWMSLYLHTAAGRPEFVIISGGSTIVDIWPADVISPNIWYHLAVTRSGSTFRMFLNGALIGTGTNASAVPDYTDDYRVGFGRWNGDTGVYAGYISNFRILKGTALYTTPFVPPVLPPTAIANTSLLLNATNAGIPDATAKNVLETVGGAAISTAQSKFGGSSMSFDGTGDYLLAPSNHRNIEFLAGDFTIECWIRFAVVGNGQIITGLTAANTIYWQYFSSQLAFGQNNIANIAATNWSPTANTWYHIAVTRSGTTVRQFVDGVQLGSNVTSSASFANGPIQIGSGGAGALNGYLDDLRITRGYARYTANFTPPTQAFPTQ